MRASLLDQSGWGCTLMGPRRLVQHLDRVPDAHRAFNQHSAIDAGLAVMGLGDLAQDLGIALGGIRIERDHRAPRVPFEDRDDNLRADAEILSNVAILRETVRRWEIRED